MGVCKSDIRCGADGQSRDEQGRATPPPEQRNAGCGSHHERDEPELRDALGLALQDSFAFRVVRRSRGVVRRYAA